MDKQSQIEELSLEICQYLIPEAFHKDTPPKVRAEHIASRLLNRGYVKVKDETSPFGQVSIRICLENASWTNWTN